MKQKGSAERSAELEALFGSKTFCMAKWQNANIDLITGLTRSCHHNPAQKLSLETLAKNPLAMHNTPEKKQDRKQMLQGEWPKGCHYCERMERINPEAFSDRRMYNGLDRYRPTAVEAIKQGGWRFDPKPSYVEVSFSSLCNFKCGYCHPQFSSRFYDEIQEHGPYPADTHNCRIDQLEKYDEGENPWLESWWRFFEASRDELNILRITGGEPLVQKSTWKLLDQLAENPQPQLDLRLNSNLGAPRATVDRFWERVEKGLREKHFGGFRLFASIDTWGEPAEYVRFGLKCDLFEANLKSYLSRLRRPLVLMVVYHIFTVPYFRRLLEKVLEWKEFSVAHGGPTILHDINILVEPLPFDLNILPKEEFLHYSVECLEFIERNWSESDPTKFTSFELDRYRMVHDYMKQPGYSGAKLAAGRRDFHLFFTEYDRRRGTHLTQSCPELASFLESCAPRASLEQDLIHDL